MTTRTLRTAAGLAAAVGALAVGVPAAGAATLPPQLYDAGLAPGQVEHGVVDFSITGSPQPQHTRTEYWESQDRWRTQTTDAQTGEVLRQAVHDATGTTWYAIKPTPGVPRVEHFNGPDVPPGAGYPAPYNALLLAGTDSGSDTHPEHVTLQAVGPVTVAGFAGTKYEEYINGRTGTSDDLAGAHVYITLENGTNKPLARESTAPNGASGQFDQTETLVSREVSTDGSLDANLSKKAFTKSIKSWKAKVAAYKVKKHHKK